MYTTGRALLRKLIDTSGPTSRTVFELCEAMNRLGFDPPAEAGYRVARGNSFGYAQGLTYEVMVAWYSGQVSESDLAYWVRVLIRAGRKH